MNKEQHLLIRLMEECDEVSQRASKALLFGTTEVQEGQPLTNAQRIMYEFADLVAIMELCEEEGFLGTDEATFQKAVALKKEKVSKYLSYCKSLGTLTEEGDEYMLPPGSAPIFTHTQEYTDKYNNWLKR